MFIIYWRHVCSDKTLVGLGWRILVFYKKYMEMADSSCYSWPRQPCIPNIRCKRESAAWFFFFFFCSEFFQQAAALPLFLGLFEHFLWIPGSRPGDVQTLRILFPWNGFPPCPILIRILNCVKVLHFTSRGHCLTLSEVLTEKPLIWSYRLCKWKSSTIEICIMSLFKGNFRILSVYRRISPKMLLFYDGSIYHDFLKSTSNFFK